MVNSGTFESSHGQEGDKNVIASCLQPPPSTVGGPPDAESSSSSSDEKLRCSVPLEKLDGVLTTYQHDDPAKTRSTTRKLLCLYCDRTFVSVNLRQKHVERLHSSKNVRRVSSRKQNQLTVTPCAYCDKLNSTENTLKDLFLHLVQRHPDKYFGCVPCEDRFLTQALLADHHVHVHRASLPAHSVKSPAKTTLKETPPEELFQEKEVVIKITRSRVKPRQEEDADEEVKPKLKGKKLGVKSTRMALKKRESKRLQALAKIADGTKKKRAKPERKQLAGGKVEQQNSTKSEKAKPSSSAANPYPEFDNFYRVKKITDHSIDNLKISSLTFDDVFDKAFFNRIKCNIEENLLHHIDGKLFKNEESETRISNFEKVSSAAPEIQNPSGSDNYGCELSLNAVTPVASLFLNSHFGEDFESQIEYGSKPSKKKTQTKTDQVFHYKYFTRRKFQASILQQKENRDLSKLDMWTQLVIKNRQQKIIDDKKSAKEIQEYASCNEHKSKLKREDLNRILDRRGPFEDLKEEASKKAALDKLNSASPDSISHESFSDVREVLDELLARVFVAAGETQAEVVEERVAAKREDQREPPGHLELRRTSALPSEGDIDRSDRIALICSSQETENYELPTNRARRQNELVELSGEWARCRMYVCAACGAKLPNMKYLLDHKSLYHQNVWVQHYEFVGNQNELYRHLSIPALGKVGFVEDNFQSKIWKRSEARVCTKCGKQCNSLGELHRHILECGGDWSWMLARKKCKYRPCKSRRKRLRGLVHRIRHKEKDGPTEKKKYKKTFDGPRQRPSDAETIQRMLANLPAKRSTRKLISLYEGACRARKSNQIQQQSLNQKKVKCGKVIYKTSSIKENTEKTINAAPTGLKTQKPSQSSNRRSLRNMSRVLSSRILDTNANLNVKRKLKALCEKRSTRQSKVSSQTFAGIDLEQAAPSEEAERVEDANAGKGRLDNRDAAAHKRTSPRATHKNLKIMNVKKLLTGNINMKSFFPVKKQKTRKALRETQASESADKNVDAKAKTKRKSNEPDGAAANEERLEKASVPKTTKSSAIKRIMRSLSMKRKPVKTPVENTTGSKPADKDTRSQTSLSDGVNFVEAAETDNKRKLKRSFRNVINRVKRLKIDNASESLHIDTKELVDCKSTFLGETNLEHPNQSVKIVIPSNSEAKENLADISESAHIATNFNKPNGDSPVPENIFKLGSNDEKSLQAKGNLDFDSQQVTEKVIESNATKGNIEEKTETEISQKISLVNEKIEPLTIETSEKPKAMPLVSPNIKGKIKKPSRGLNDCIAMLTSKLQQKTKEPVVKVGIFNLGFPTTAPRILSDPAPQKSDCILKIPTFKSQQEPSGAEEIALDLSVKSKDHGLDILEVPKSVQISEAAFAVAKKPYFEPFPFSISKIPDLTNSVEEIINSVIENNFHKESNHKIWKTWNAVDDTIQCVIDGYHKRIPEASLTVSKNSVDDIIDFVATHVKDKGDGNTKLSLILKQPGDRVKLKTSKKLSPSKKTKKSETLKNLSRPIIDMVSTIPEDSIPSSSAISERLERKSEGLTTKVTISKPIAPEFVAVENIPPLATPVKINNFESKVTDIPPNNLDITIEYVVKDLSNAEESKPDSIDPIAKTAVKKLSQFRRNKDKQKNISNSLAKPFVETHLDNVLDTSEVNCKPDAFTSPPIIQNIVGEDFGASKPEEFALANEDEPHVLENKVVVQTQPSDSEDDIPLAALVKPIEASKIGPTADAVHAEECLNKLEQVGDVCDGLAGASVETVPPAIEEHIGDEQHGIPLTTPEEDNRLESITSPGVEDANKSLENQKEVFTQVINDSVEFKVPVPKPKKAPTKKRSLAKKKQALRKNEAIESASLPKDTETDSTREPQTYIPLKEATISTSHEDSTDNLPLAVSILGDKITNDLKDDAFITSQEVSTDDLFVKDLPFANEELFPDIAPTPKGNTNQRRTKKKKLTRRKSKKKNAVPVIDILKDVSKPTDSTDLNIFDKPTLEPVNQIELTEILEESSSSSASKPYSEESIANEELLIEKMLDSTETTFPETNHIVDTSSTSSTDLLFPTGTEDSSIAETEISEEGRRLNPKVVSHIDTITENCPKHLEIRLSDTTEHNFKIPMSDDSMMSDAIKPNNFKKKCTRSRAKTTKRSKSLKVDLGMSSSDESSSSPVKLRSRSLKKYYREPSSDDSSVNEPIEPESSMESESKTTDKKTSLLVDTSATIISETMITLRKQLGLPSEDLTEPAEEQQELMPKRSARLSASKGPLQDNESPVAVNLQGVHQTPVTEMVFKTPTKKRKPKKPYLAVSTDESDLNENSDLSTTEDTPDKKRPKPARNVFNHPTSESEIEESSQSDASSKTRTKRGSRSLVNEFKEPELGELHKKVDEEEKQLTNCDSAVEEPTSAVDDDVTARTKKVSKRRGKPMKFSRSFSESSDSDFLDFQSRRPLRKSRIAKTDISKSAEGKEGFMGMATGTEESDSKAQRPKRSTRILNTNVNIAVEKTTEVTKVSSELPANKKTKTLRKNGNSEPSPPDMSNELVIAFGDLYKSGLEEHLEVDILAENSNKALQRPNSRSLRRKLAVNYSEIEESTNLPPSTVEDANKLNEIHEPGKTIPDPILDEVEPDDSNILRIPPVAATDALNGVSKEDESASRNPISAATVSKRSAKKKKNATRSKIPPDASEKIEELTVASLEPSTECNASIDTPAIAPVMSSDTIKDTETDPPIKIIINKQKARRKSKNIKKIDCKGPNDLFEDFALVIKKKRTTPFMSFSPPNAFSKEDTDTYSLFLPKLPEVEQVPDDNCVFQDRAELDVSVEEMDMELDEIPINASIIENTLNLSLPIEKSSGTDDSFQFDSPEVEATSITSKNKTRNGRKNKISRNKKLPEESDLKNPVGSEDIPPLVMEEYAQLDMLSLSKVVNSIKSNIAPLEEIDAIVEKITEIQKFLPVNRTPKNGKQNPVEESADFGLPQLPHIGDTVAQIQLGGEENNATVEIPEEAKNISKYADFDMFSLSHEKNTVEKNMFNGELVAIVENPREDEIPKISNKSKGESMDEYVAFALPPMENTKEEDLLIDKQLNATVPSPIGVETMKTLKRTSRKAKKNSMNEYAELGISALFMGNTVKNDLSVEYEMDVKISSTKFKPKSIEESAEFDIPAHVGCAIENTMLIEEELNVPMEQKDRRTCKKSKGFKMGEYAETDMLTMPQRKANFIEDLVDENELDVIVEIPKEVEKHKTSKRALNRSKGIDEYAEFALSHMENAKEKDLLEEQLNSTVQSPKEIETMKTGKRISRKAKKNTTHLTESDISAAFCNMDNKIENKTVEEQSKATANPMEVDDAMTVEITSNKSKRKSVDQYAEIDNEEKDPIDKEESGAVAAKSKPVKVFKKMKRKPKNKKSPTDILVNDDKSTEERVAASRTSPVEPENSTVVPESEMPLRLNETLSNVAPASGDKEDNTSSGKDKDIDLIYAFSETEDLEINTPIELPRRLPRNLDKIPSIADGCDQKDGEEPKTKKKPRQKKIFSAENSKDDERPTVGDIKPMRSAKVKALEHIHDDALAELTESERNRELKSTKATQNEGEASIDTTNKKNKKHKKNQTAPEIIENASFSYEALAEDEAPLLAELVAELHGLEELENSIERELSADMNEINKRTNTSIDKDATTEGSMPNMNAETIFEDNQELRRSRRGSRKVASYNENDLIDPIIDALENKRTAKKKEAKAAVAGEVKIQKKGKEPEKLNSDQLFDLLKASTTESIHASKQQNTFLNTLGDVSDDTVFGELQEKNKGSEKFYDFNDSSVTTEQVLINKSLILSKQSDESSLSSSSYKLLTPDIQDSSTSEESRSKPVAVVESNYCEICNKSFIRVENLVKHRRTLTHIQKLSEIEAKEAELKLLQERAAQTSPTAFTNTHSLKLADIISDVLNKPVLEEEASTFPDIVLQNSNGSEVKRYKSLGERKSFESDSNLLDAESKTTILEKQISLLEDIIENKGNTSYIDDISLSSEDSVLSVKQVAASKTPSASDGSFLKPTQYEEISEDSANLRSYEDQKHRKTLNRDEELFLECCSLLKSGSEVSSSYSNKRMPHKDLGAANVLGWHEKRNPVHRPEIDLEDDYSDDNSRVPTPLGDSFDDGASDSNTISSDWGVNDVRETCVKEDGSTRMNFQGISAGGGDGDLKFQELLNKDRSPFIQDLSSKVTVEPKIEEIDSKKIITKGARKVFEGLKVSIPTEELNLEEVLNCSPKLKKPEVPTCSDKLPFPTASKPTKNARKSKPVKKSQVGSNILFKVNKKKLLSPTAFPQASPDKDTKSYDVYDFEETQDNTDVFTKPDFKAFRHSKPGDNEGDSEPESIGLEPESVTSSVSSISSAKKTKDQENITKKKCMIMGRIFKNATKSKIEDIDEEIRTIPALDNGELVESYVASCNTKPKLSEREMNQLFDELLDAKPDRDSATKTSKKPEQKKKPKPKGKKRVRANSESTDDEFSLNTTKRRSGKKNGKEEDNCINLEQELKECIGVASRKSQRSCTSGKQNVLVEYWSSDDSQFEAMLEKQIIEVKPARKPPVSEPPPVAEGPGMTEHRNKPHKKKPADKKLDARAASNRRKRAAANPLYHWSSSSEDEASDLIEVKPLREAEDEEDRPVQHGWIVGESPKKLVMMLAQAKGKKTDIDCVKEQGKKRTSAVS